MTPYETPYEAAAWHDLFVAVAGASAALAGLIFVAVSINLQRIATSPHLPSRAAQFLSVLVGLLLLSTVMLTPGQPPLALGAELTGLGAVLLTFVLVLLIRTPRLTGSPRWWTTLPATVAALSSLPLLAAGVSELTRTGGGLYWLLPEVLFAFAGSVYNAWVLLIEIVRRHTSNPGEQGSNERQKVDRW